MTHRFFALAGALLLTAVSVHAQASPAPAAGTRTAGYCGRPGGMQFRGDTLIVPRPANARPGAPDSVMLRVYEGTDSVAYVFPVKLPAMRGMVASTFAKALVNCRKPPFDADAMLARLGLPPLGDAPAGANASAYRAPTSPQTIALAAMGAQEVANFTGPLRIARTSSFDDALHARGTALFETRGTYRHDSLQALPRRVVSIVSSLASGDTLAFVRTRNAEPDDGCGHLVVLQRTPDGWQRVQVVPSPSRCRPGQSGGAR